MCTVRTHLGPINNAENSQVLLERHPLSLNKKHFSETLSSSRYHSLWLKSILALYFWVLYEKPLSSISRYHRQTKPRELQTKKDKATGHSDATP